MDVLEVDRVIIATPELNETAALFGDLLDVSFGGLLEPTTESDEGDQSVANRISPTGLELVTTCGDDGEVARFLDENGPGLYAVSFRVADLDAARESLADRGVEPVGEYRKGAFAELFYHPREFAGAFVILAEYDETHPAETAAERGEAARHNH
jgi:methylmalonyl-CoA/ethylmalonyl-CoA epimerase